MSGVKPSDLSGMKVKIEPSEEKELADRAIQEQIAAHQLNAVQQQVSRVPYYFGHKMVFFFLPKQSQKSRSILQDRSRTLGLFKKGKTGIVA